MSGHRIELSSGALLDLADPRPEAISLADVAHGLSHVCRFTGQCRRFYSVAEHAVLVATKLEAENAAPHVILAGLHHDDAEAFVGDVTRPLKALLPGYQQLEDAVGVAIGEALALPPLVDPVERAQVNAADDWALHCEAHQLLRSGGLAWPTAQPFDPAGLRSLRFPYAVLGQSPLVARTLWLGWHQELTQSIEGRAA